MLAKKDLQKLSQIRIQEAITLFNNRLYSGSYYLSGYSIELALKVCACNLFSGQELPDKNLVTNLYKHNLDHLAKAVGIYNDLLKEMQNDGDFASNWSIVVQWSPDSRYEIYDQFQANAMINSITDKKSGVMKWIKKYW